MQGYRVDRKAGWDCQGLPVEVAVEKELGLSGKRQIEEYGIAEFNAKCRESVAALDRRVRGDDRADGATGSTCPRPTARWTPSYIESVWWSLKQIFDKGLLYEAHRVTPYCPRCETGLSDHELGQPGGYETVVDPSVFVRLPLTSGPYAGQADLLIWTTTPWTLVSNTAVSVNPDVDVRAGDRRQARPLVVAEPLFESVLGDGWTIQDRVVGRDMERWAYQRPLELVDFPPDEPAHFVVLADYVTTEDGTGLVHQSPAFGGEDMEVATAYGLPVVNPVRRDGHFDDDVPLVGGQFFKHADADLVRELESRGRAVPAPSPTSTPTRTAGGATRR